MVNIALSCIVFVLFDVEYLRNATRYRYSCNEILIGTYTLLNSVITNDLE